MDASFLSGPQPVLTLLSAHFMGSLAGAFPSGCVCSSLRLRSLIPCVSLCHSSPDMRFQRQRLSLADHQVQYASCQAHIFPSESGTARLLHLQGCSTFCPRVTRPFIHPTHALIGSTGYRAVPGAGDIHMPVPPLSGEPPGLPQALRLSREAYFKLASPTSARNSQSDPGQVASHV